MHQKPYGIEFKVANSPTVADFCPNTDRMVPDPHYKSVCRLNRGSEVTCPCAADRIQPTECCTAEGTTEKTEKCNGEDSCNISITLLLLLGGMMVVQM